MNNRRIKDIILMALLIVLILFAVLLIIYGGIFYVNDYGKASKITIFDGWVYIDGEGKEISTELPSRIQCGLGDTLILKNTIPEDIGGNFVMMSYVSKQKFNVYIDDELVYSDGYDEFLPFMGTETSQWSIIPLKQEYAGKTIVIEASSQYFFYTGMINKIYLDSDSAIYNYILLYSMAFLAMAMVFLMLGLVFITTAAVFRKNIPVSKEVAGLGMCFIAVCSFLLALNGIYGEIIPNTAVVAFLDAFTYFFIPVIFIRYLKIVSGERHEGFFDVILMLCYAYSIIVIILQLFGINCLVDCSALVAYLFGALILVIIIKLICPKKGIRNVPLKSILPLSFVFIGLSFDLYLFISSQMFYSGISTLISILSFLAVSGISSLKNFFESRNKMVRMKEELADEKLAKLNCQIKPHFIFNSLSAIRYLIRTEPQKAEYALGAFSKYLRNCADLSSEKRTVGLSEELKCVGSYLELEKINLGDRLKVITDIKAEFELPTLTLQPLVENAVKHGIASKHGGGTLKIMSYEDEKNYYLTVSDDGTGFDTSKSDNDGITHVGIENVKNRLEKISGGTLSILSEIDNGTKVTIKIPKMIIKGEENA